MAMTEHETYPHLHFAPGAATFEYLDFGKAVQSSIGLFLQTHPAVQQSAVVFQRGRSLSAANAIFESPRSQQPSLHLVLSACARQSGISSSTWTAWLRGVAAGFCDKSEASRNNHAFVYMCNKADSTILRAAPQSDPGLQGCTWHFHDMELDAVSAAQIWLMHLLSHPAGFGHLNVFLSIGGLAAGGWQPAAGTAVDSVRSEVLHSTGTGFTAASMRSTQIMGLKHAQFVARKDCLRETGCPTSAMLTPMWQHEHGDKCQMPRVARGEFVATDAAVRRMLAR